MLRVAGRRLLRGASPRLAAGVLVLLASGAPCRAVDAARPPLQVRYEGTLALEAHYQRPGDIRTYHCDQIYRADGRGNVRLDRSTWNDVDTSRAPETFLVVGDSVFHRDAPGAEWVLEVGTDTWPACWQALGGLPAETDARWRFLRTSRSGIATDPYQLICAVVRRAHPRLGDVEDSVAYSYRPLRVPAPESMRQTLHLRDMQWRLEQRRTSWSAEAAPESLFAAPARFERSTPDPDSLVDPPRLASLAPGVWAADMVDIDSRSLIVEFAGYLAVIEFAVGSENGERIADAARRQWPGKSIRYALFSHHHPHYIGGVRAMIAEGATVVTTPGNEALVREMAARPFTIRPDRLARSPRPPQIRTFTDRFELADSTNQLVALNYGKRSDHTDEFVVFWLPRAKLLFQTEQGWVLVEGKLRASRRAGPLLGWIDEQKMDVERLVQSWPMRGYPTAVTRADLEGLVKQRGK